METEERAGVHNRCAPRGSPIGKLWDNYNVPSRTLGERRFQMSFYGAKLAWRNFTHFQPLQSRGEGERLLLSKSDSFRRK